MDFCSPEDHNGAVHRCLHGIMHLIDDHARRAGIPLRFAASKLAEGDHMILEKLGLDQNEREMLEHIIQQMEEERGMDRAAAIADMRYGFIEFRLPRSRGQAPGEQGPRPQRKSGPVFDGQIHRDPGLVGIMALVFYLTFGPVGSFLSDLLALGIDALTALVDRGAHGLRNQSRGPIPGHRRAFSPVVGSVLSFLPVIVTLFFFLSLLEDSGYIARVAFVMDKLLRKIGLSGRSIVPMLIGFGCTVPGVMATRTLPSERDRR